MVARVPESEPRWSPVNLRWRAYQLAADPESAATMALAGKRVESSQTRRCGLTNPSRSLSVMAWRSTVSHQSATFSWTVLRHERSDLRSRSGNSA